MGFTVKVALLIAALTVLQMIRVYINNKKAGGSSMPNKKESENTHVGDRYWAYIEPHYDRVDIYHGVKSFLKEFNNTPEPARNLLAAHWLDSEVRNGGFHQFFDNPTGILAPEAVVGFTAIGMPKVVEVINKAMSFFNDKDSSETTAEYPRERSIRRRMLSKHTKDPEVETPFDELDDKYYELIDEENGGFGKLADNYAKKYS